MPYIVIKGFPKDDETVRRVAERINATLLELWGCRREHINISYKAIPPEKWDERIERGEIARNKDKMLMFGGEWTSGEKTPANVHAMHTNKPSRTKNPTLSSERTTCTLSMQKESSPRAAGAAV